MEASVTIPRPMINATTAFAWCAGTSSTGGSTSAEGESGGDRVEVGSKVEFIACAPLQEGGPQREERNDKEEVVETVGDDGENVKFVG